MVNEISFLCQKWGGVKITNCTGNLRKIPITHMKPYISRLVSIYGIRWNIHHMLLVKITKLLLPTEYPFCANDGGQNDYLHPVMSEKHLKHIWKPYISRLVSIYGIRWNIYHVMPLKLRNSIATKYPFFGPK